MHRVRSNAILGLMALLLPQAARAGISDAAIVSAVQSSAGADFSVVWSDPTYLFHDFSFTPVVEAGLARFQAPAGVDVGAMLVLLTQVSPQNPSGLYPHDYRVCQSIHVASLVGLSPFHSGNGEFLMMEMQQPSIDEFAATLQVREDSGSYVVDSQLFSVLYASGLPGSHYTFQIWSKDAATTKALVGRLLAGLASRRPLVFTNTAPRPIPVAVLHRLQMIGDRVMLDLEAPQAVDALDVTLVSWQYPNPTPNVSHSTQRLPAGRFMTLLPVTAATTDAQVYLDYHGVLQDKALTSFNAWGPLSSGWFPFADASGSSAAVTRAPLSGSLPVNREVAMNGSAVRLSGTLVAGGFVGMFVDVLPALQTPGDLTAYDTWVLRMRQTSASSSLPVEVKLELDDGTTRSTMLAVGLSWETQQIPVSRFGDWATLGTHLKRVVIAVSGAPGQIALDLDRLSLTARDVPCTGCVSALPPTVVTLSAGPLGYTSGRLNGSVNPNGAATLGWFEWGATSSYGAKTPYQDLGSGSSAVALALPIASLACSVRYHFRAAAANANGTSLGADQVVSLPQCPPRNGGRRLFTVTPCRILDTRLTQAYGSGTAYPVTVGGPTCGIPTSARAVVANITVVGGTGAGYLAAWTASDPMPGTSVISFAAGQVKANNALLAMDTTTGGILLQPVIAGGGSVHVIVDVAGYFD